MKRLAMDLRKLKTLIDLVSESNVTELEVNDADGKIRIVKASPSGPSAQPLVGTAQAISGPSSHVAALHETSTATNDQAAAAPMEQHTLKSPMVGTFYSAASPDAKPFVELGSSVKQGQAICIIEAMKILNEVEADKTGIIRQILAKNGQALEYGQPLFVIE
jgi:acetyl-CoA carboxylase biotin carboxyl carrier protein